MLIASNNQWKCDTNKPLWEEKGLDCSAEGRVGGLLRAYHEILPDVLGLQEVSLHMADLFMADMRRIELADGKTAKYELISGGDTPIVYRRDKLKLLESGFFRYTEAIPKLEGSFNNGETKSWCWGVFSDRTDGKTFAVMSTHLWWKSSVAQPGSNEARAYQIKQACAQMEWVMGKYSCPGIILGDFNASLNSLCLQAAFAEGWTEVFDLTADRCDTRGHHYCCNEGFGRRDDGGKFVQAIDHIIVKNQGDAKINYFRRLEDEWFDPISDHYPLYIDIDF